MDVGDKKTLRRVIREKYDDLGPMSFHQASVLFFFIGLILLWFFRDPQFIPGRGSRGWSRGESRGASRWASRGASRGGSREWG